MNIINVFTSPDCMSSHVDFLVRHLGPQNDVGDDFDGGVESAAVDGCGVEKSVASRLAVALPSRDVQS